MAQSVAKLTNQGLPPVPGTTSIAINHKETWRRIIDNQLNHTSTVEDVAIGDIHVLVDPFDRPIGPQGFLLI